MKKTKDSTWDGKSTPILIPISKQKSNTNIDVLDLTEDDVILITQVSKTKTPLQSSPIDSWVKTNKIPPNLKLEIPQILPESSKPPSLLNFKPHNIILPQSLLEPNQQNEKKPSQPNKPSFLQQNNTPSQIHFSSSTKPISTQEKSQQTHPNNKKEKDLSPKNQKTQPFSSIQSSVLLKVSNNQPLLQSESESILKKRINPTSDSVKTKHSKLDPLNSPSFRNTFTSSQIDSNDEKLDNEEQLAPVVTNEQNFQSLLLLLENDDVKAILSEAFKSKEWKKHRTVVQNSTEISESKLSKMKDQERDLIARVYTNMDDRQNPKPNKPSTDYSYIALKLISLITGRDFSYLDTLWFSPKTKKKSEKGAREVAYIESELQSNQIAQLESKINSLSTPYDARSIEHNGNTFTVPTLKNCPNFLSGQKFVELSNRIAAIKHKITELHEVADSVIPTLDSDSNNNHRSKTTTQNYFEDEGYMMSDEDEILSVSQPNINQKSSDEKKPIRSRLSQMERSDDDISDEGDIFSVPYGYEKKPDENNKAGKSRLTSAVELSKAKDKGKGKARSPPENAIVKLSTHSGEIRLSETTHSNKSKSKSPTESKNESALRRTTSANYENTYDDDAPSGALSTSIRKIDEDFAKGGSRLAIPVFNDVDNEKLPSKIKWIEKSVPGPGIGIDHSKDALLGCSCLLNQCSESKSCYCSQETGGEIAYDANGKVRFTPDRSIFECNYLCKCSMSCPNRVIQKGSTCSLDIFKTENKGWGVKARHKITKGTFVAEYVGEIISFEEAERRGKEYDSKGVSYLFDLDFAGDQIPPGEAKVIDANVYGGIARFINHSCNPNLACYNFWIDHYNICLPRIAFFARRDIQKGEELSFDYKYKPQDTKSADNRIACKCGASNCRKILY